MKIISTLKHEVKNYLYLAVLITFLASCSKTNDPKPNPGPGETTNPVKGSGKDLTSVGILKSENSGITGDGYFFKSGLKIYITVPLNSNITAVKTNFSISNKATIKVDGAVLPNNSGTLDLSKTLTAVVSAEDGSSLTYTIIAQAGIIEIDKMIYPFMEKYSLPAASYAIGKNSREEIVYKNASGFANVATNERATSDYEFRLASMSKQHTSIAIMTLIQQGKFGLDDLVFGPTGILKASPFIVGPKSAKVTVRHLLEHTAGYSGDPMFTSSSGATLDAKIQFMINSAQNEPGTVYSYYNMGYGTLGKIVEVVSGQEFGAYLKTIYAPAGAEVNMASRSADARRAKEAIYYSQNGGNPYGTDIDVYKAAGGVSINTENLFKVLYAVDGGGIRPDILTPTIRTMMFTKSTRANYALGWRTGHSLFEGFYHGGNLNGTATFWIYGSEYSVAVLLNSRSVDTGFDAELVVLTNNILDKAKQLGL